MAFIEGWPHLRGGLYEGFHCIVTMSVPYAGVSVGVFEDSDTLLQ